MCENNENSLDLNEIPIRAMSLSVRHQLSQYLNGEQLITTSNGLSRDYRGLAQLMGFSYTLVNNIMRTTDPLNSLFDTYQNRSDATFGQLVQMVEQIERFDIIDDMTPALLNDAKHYLKDKQLKRTSIQRPDLMTVCEPQPQPLITYDAYVCYSDKDFDFVQELSEFLESPEIGLRLFIRDRDMCLGSWAYESFAQLMDRQCNKALIVLSPDFLECPECDFQTAFATGLAIEQRNRKLIPIIYRKCDLPPIVRMLTKIDLTRNTDKPNSNGHIHWSYKRLVDSIRSNAFNNSIVYRQNSRSEYSRPTLLQLPSNSSNSSTDSPLISIETIDESISLPSVCPSPTAPALVSTQSSICSSINSEMSDKSDNSESIPILSAQKDKNSKKPNHKKWIQSFKQKFKS